MTWEKKSQMVQAHDYQLDLSTLTVRVGIGVGLRAFNSLPSPTFASAKICDDSFVTRGCANCEMNDSKYVGDRSGLIIAIGVLGIGGSALRSAPSIYLVDRRLEACEL